jgi:hypothetical protein
MTRPSKQAVFSGVLAMSEGHYLLPSGGLVAELVLAPGEAKELSALVGQTVSFRGRQTAARIEQAQMVRVPAAEAAAAPEQSRFAAVFAAIDAQGAALKSLPNVVSVRPGFRRAAGHFTSEPAMVVTVRRKLDTDELGPAAIVPKAIGNVPVDVVVADPLEVIAEMGVGAEPTPVGMVRVPWDAWYG